MPVKQPNNQNIYKAEYGRKNLPARDSKKTNPARPEHGFFNFGKRLYPKLCWI